MRPLLPEAPGCARRLAWLLLTALLLTLLPRAPAGAAPANPLVAAIQHGDAKAAPASVPLTESLDQVIGTLQDDTQRKALLEQLRALRSGLTASASAPVAPASSPGLIGAVAQALDEVDTQLRTDHGPWHYWRWRSQFAAEEWHAAATLNGTRPALDSLREFVIVIGGWALCGWVLWEIGHRIRVRRRKHAESAVALLRKPRSGLPDVPSWMDVGIYMLRRIGPWVAAFGLTVLLAYRHFSQAPASVAAVMVAHAIVAGAIAAAACQVIFALFRTAHRRLAVHQLLTRSPWLLFCTGALAALGNSATDSRITSVLGNNLCALLSTAANVAAAILIGVFALRFRRQVGQLIAQRPLEFRQSHPALTDLLRLAGQAWHLPVLAVVVASVIGTILATGHADVFLRRTVASVALFVIALLLTLVAGRSPKARVRAPRIRDRRRSAYLQRFGRFAMALVRVVIWATVVELGARIWGTSVLHLVESSPARRHIAESLLSVTATVLLAWLTWLVIDTAITQALSPTHGRAAAQPSLRAKTILPLVRNASFVALLVIAMMVVLANLGVNVTPLLAGAGVVGLAIGFGAQSLVQDLITGLFIVIEDSIAIGDSIELPDHAGVVEAMTIRTVKLRDGKGALHTLPYSQIKAVKNLSRGYGYAVFNICLAYQSDLDRALDLIRSTGSQIARDHRYTRKLLSGLEILGLDRFDPGGPVVMAQVKTRPLMQAEITRAFNALLKRQFDANGIRLASPSLTIRLDGGTAGTASAEAVISRSE
ncbi:mechanosensitive ion channel [Cupriavidus sp. WKF15]|uniref:mechanosensitive ion channel family protein n=1 Tax=Cupriavidus sp. WKF15 TaxID=3032282 RepID=UPI0023E23996|nr:mechanosensitive ion channel family protein [Cupriavidus sp. WKF15]WER50056.1 mechanosensitive ion channel [Cupriavidus sp. WKF15]